MFQRITKSTAIIFWVVLTIFGFNNTNAQAAAVPANLAGGRNKPVNCNSESDAPSKI